MSKPHTQITPMGWMSNLVGKWAIVPENGKPKYTVFVYGRADNDFFMVQAVSALDGHPNVIRLVQTAEMREWSFYDNPELVAEEMAHFNRTGSPRYSLSLPHP